MAVSASTSVASVKSHNGHRHSKSASDPFLDLSDDALSIPGRPIPSEDKVENGHGHLQSLLANLVLTPIIMISFLLSLFVVDHQQRQWRLSQHASGPSSRSWLDPQPYQDSHTGGNTESSSVSDRNTSYSSYRGWYMHKKRRALAKLEINDAFEMRGRMMYAVLAWVLLSFCAFGYALRQLSTWLW